MDPVSGYQSTGVTRRRLRGKQTVSGDSSGSVTPPTREVPVLQDHGQYLRELIAKEKMHVDTPPEAGGTGQFSGGGAASSGDVDIAGRSPHVAS